MPDDREIRSIYNEVKAHTEKSVPVDRSIVSAEERLRQEFLEVWRNYLRIKSQGYSLRDRLAFLRKIYSSFSGTVVDISIVTTEISSVEKELQFSEKDKDFNVRFNLGLRKYKSGQYPESLEIWEALFKDFPDHPTLKEYILQTRKELSARISFLSTNAAKEFQKGNWLEAVRNWELVVELDPQNNAVKNRLAETKRILKSDYDTALNLYKQGLYGKAIEKWQEILNKYPNYPGVNAAIAKASDDLSSARRPARLDAAEKFFEQAERHFAGKNFFAGVETLRKIIEIDPQNTRAKDRIDSVTRTLAKNAEELYNKNSYFESHELWGVLVKINPSDRKAREMLNLCMRNFEESQNKYIVQGENAFNSGNYVLALENFKKVLQVAPNNKKIIDMLVESYLAQGIVYYRTERLDEAISEWDNALKLSPNNEKAKAYRTRAVTKKETLRRLKNE